MLRTFLFRPCLKSPASTHFPSFTPFCHKAKQELQSNAVRGELSLVCVRVLQSVLAYIRMHTSLLCGERWNGG